MAKNDDILRLMAVPPPDHDLAWLKDSLRAAAKLEFATIPPYLTAMWSIKNRQDPVYQSIRTIVREEMRHMGLACNMLVGIGGDLALNTPDAVPTYPGGLPGGVHPNLQVSLGGLTPAAVKTFMEIEYPTGGPIPLESVETYPTIGEFYDAVLAAIEALRPAFAPDRQVDEDLVDLKKVLSVDDARTAIGVIKHQGEGSKDSPADTGPDDLAHYYRFAEIDKGLKIEPDPSAPDQWKWGTEPVPFPETWPVAPVPAGGYRPEDAPGPVADNLRRFDATFTDMLDHLQAAWQAGDADRLEQAVDAMRAMRTPAVELMKVPIPNGQGNYGPCFRLVRQA